MFNSLSSTNVRNISRYRLYSTKDSSTVYAVIHYSVCSHSLQCMQSFTTVYAAIHYSVCSHSLHCMQSFTTLYAVIHWMPSVKSQHIGRCGRRECHGLYDKGVSPEICIDTSTPEILVTQYWLLTFNWFLMTIDYKVFMCVTTDER